MDGIFLFFGRDSGQGQSNLVFLLTLNDGSFGRTRDLYRVRRVLSKIGFLLDVGADVGRGCRNRSIASSKTLKDSSP